MKHIYRVPKIVSLLGLLIAFAITSCTSGKQLSYFSDLPDSTVVHLPPVKSEERVIAAGERLNISISAKDNEAASYFIKTGGVSSPGSGDIKGANGGAAESGYMVDDNGFIEFPIIGKVKASGLTAKQLKENLTKHVGPYLKEPLVDVNFVTFKVTILGEVRGTGSFSLPTQKATIFDALAAAGDLPRTAKRYDVQLYRDYNGQRKVIKFDLRKKELLNNPDVFYLKHNDVIYVQPRAGTIVKEDVTFFSSLITIAIGVITLGLTLSNY